MKRWGRPVSVLYAGVEGEIFYAFLQSLQYKNKLYLQDAMTPIGASKQDYFLYIGPAEQLLTKEFRLKAGSQVYRVVKSEPVYMGREVLYVWAVVRKEASSDGAV